MEAILTYCPYRTTLSHIAPTLAPTATPPTPPPLTLALPSCLVVANTGDPRVPTWHSIKYIAAQRLLRQNRAAAIKESRQQGLKSRDGEVLFELMDVDGHTGLGGRYGFARDHSVELAFLLGAVEQQ